MEPKIYYKWLKYIVKRFKPYSEEENFIFLNAMNEWAEGNYIEPDLKFGNQFLEVLKQELSNETS